MKTFTADELKEVLAQHALWLSSDHEQGVRADLRGADLTDANLTYANLTRANLTYANLTRANLTRANLTRANLTDANLTDADLTDANLTRANLAGVASILGIVGNMQNIKSIQADYWPVSYTTTHMQVGCQLHLISEWWAFSLGEIAQMDDRAAAWWVVWKPILQTIIEVSPAVPTK